MIEEIKKIKVEELNSQIKQYEEQKASIMQRLNQLNEQLRELKNEQSYGMTVKGNFSFLEKWITRRHDYKTFKRQSKRFSELPELISKAESEIAEENERVQHELETSQIDDKLFETACKMDFIKKAKTLREIGITPIDAIKLLESKGIPPVLTEEDKVVYVNPRDYSSKSSLIGVHKTKYAPTANMIKSAKDANVEMKENITINGVNYEYSFKSARDTVHMAMNDEVGGHLMGNWDNCKYAILIPFDDIPNKKIGRALATDTFTRESIELSENAWILCPKNEVDRLKVFNPKAHVLGYEGEDVKGFSKPFLTQLGYRAENVCAVQWEDIQSNSDFYELMEKEGIKIGAHYDSYFHEDEEILININKAVSLCKLLRDNHLITSSEDIENIINQLQGNKQSFGNILEGLNGVGFSAADKEPQSIVANGKQVDVFIEEMKKNGFDISPAYQNIMKKLSKKHVMHWLPGDEDEIGNIPEEATDEERQVIENFQNNLFSLDDAKKNAAYNKFISTVICESILHSEERNIPTEKSQHAR